MKSPIKELLVSAVLYLPLCFFVWFYSAALLVIPAKWIAEMALMFWQNDLFNGINQHYYYFTVETLIFPKDQMGATGSQLAVLDVVVNPMKYGYGLAVFVGLVVSLPNTSAKYKLFQIFMGYILISIIQANGVFWETCKSLLMNAGPDAFNAINQTGISHNLVAGMYQLSYLILPAVLPIMVWVLLNRKFVEDITHFTTNEGGNES